MNPRAIKAKGRNAENQVVAYLKPFFSAVERRRLRGTKDEGDIAGIPGVVIEVKNQNRLDLAEWVNQLEAEIENAKVNFGFVIHKRRGKTDVGDWYVTLPMRIFLPLLLERNNGSSS